MTNRTITVDLPSTFFEDHLSRCEEVAAYESSATYKVIKRLSRTVRVELNEAAYKEILSDAKHYSDPIGFDWEYVRGLCMSARATLRRLEPFGSDDFVEPDARQHVGADEPVVDAYHPDTGHTTGMNLGEAVELARGASSETSFTVYPSRVHRDHEDVEGFETPIPLSTREFLDQHGEDFPPRWSDEPGKHVLNIGADEDTWNPASTKRRIHGPSQIRYRIYEDGGINFEIHDLPS